MEIALPDGFDPDLSPGASIAVNGVCLTIRNLLPNGFIANVSQETAQRTTLASLHPNTDVNLELPVTPASALDGHIVLGHVDCLGWIQALYYDRDSWSLLVSFPPAYRRYVAEKGSVAIDGISLTSFGIESSSFRCAIVPETYERTTLHERRAGDPVNLEFDVLAKYVERMMGDVYFD